MTKEKATEIINELNDILYILTKEEEFIKKLLADYGVKLPFEL